MDNQIMIKNINFNQSIDFRHQIIALGIASIYHLCIIFASYLGWGIPIMVSQVFIFFFIVWGVLFLIWLISNFILKKKGIFYSKLFESVFYNVGMRVTLTLVSPFLLLMTINFPFLWETVAISFLIVSLISLWYVMLNISDEEIKNLKKSSLISRENQRYLLWSNDSLPMILTKSKIICFIPYFLTIFFGIKAILNRGTDESLYNAILCFIPLMSMLFYTEFCFLFVAIRYFYINNKQ